MPTPPASSPFLPSAAAPPVPVRPHHHENPTGKALAALALGALGVVYGDIGTSPLYALKECFNGTHGVAPSPENVRGVLSLVFWSMTFVVSIKYLTFVMRADNRGEGGVLALLALVARPGVTGIGRNVLLLAGIFGAALLYGDGVITPAISVLGAVEGLGVAAPGLGALVVPITVAILFGLFSFQKRGTAAVGRVFGPIMLVWFATIAALGIYGISHDPSILLALGPWHAIAFFSRQGHHAFFVLGAVVLVLTGGEALYADMGHFGRRPIRVAWLSLAMPALLLNYFGQGAVILHDPAAASNPFYLVVPSWALYPTIGIATLAAIVASQALISGAFSLTNQAVQLGYSPRVTIVHTSATEYGQIYIPEVNWALGVACVALVLGFKSSDALAAAYGIAVTGTMTITTVLFHRVMRDLWKWPRVLVWPLSLAFLSADLSFFFANLVKVKDGGWFPLVAATVVFAMMSTWKRGRDALAEQLRDGGLPLDLFISSISQKPPLRIPGTAVFLASNPQGTPPVLLHHLKHNKVLHERVLLVSVINEEFPSVPAEERLTVRTLGAGFHQVIGRYGFLETPQIPALLAAIPAGAIPGPRIEKTPLETSYYLGRETLLVDGPSKMATWRKRLFIIMSRNAQTASAFFGLPPNRVVELGAQVQM